MTLKSIKSLGQFIKWVKKNQTCIALTLYQLNRFFCALRPILDYYINSNYAKSEFLQNSVNKMS